MSGISALCVKRRDGSTFLKQTHKIPGSGLRTCSPLTSGTDGDALADG